METIYVAPITDEKADFHTISEAIASIDPTDSKPYTIFIAPGFYHEKITIQRPFLTFAGTGDKPQDTILSYDDYAFAPMPDGMKRGTFRSYSVFIDTHDITMKNLTIENASGDSATHGQAIALYADGDHLFFDKVHLLGHQDTLFTGPLPPKEKEPNGFIGPKQFSPRVNGRHYYKDCYICGDVDFIFGSATAYFEHCTIESLARDTKEDSAIQGYITAASTAEGQTYGYVFSQCKFISSTCKPGTVYLGRPWREFAKTVFIHCEFGPHIHPERFHDWNKKEAHDTIFYGELENIPAPVHPAPFVKILSPNEEAFYSKSSVLS